MFFTKESSQANLEAVPHKSGTGIRTLIVDLSKRYGGATTRTVELACNLQSWGACIAGISGSPVVRVAQEQGIPVATVGKSRTDPAIPFRLSRLIRSGKFQVIDTQNIQSQFWGSMAAFLTKAALVSTLNSWYETEHGGSLKGKLYTSIELWTKSQTDQFIAVSEEVRTALLKAGVPEKDIQLIHNTINIDPDAVSGDPVALRRDLGFPADAIVGVSVGRLVWAKGYEDLIAVFEQISERLPNVHGVIVGDGPLHEQLSAQIKEVGLEKRLRLLGYRERDSVLEILKSSDIFVMPSRTEGTPLALLEAAAMGKPILATRTGGITEIVTDGLEAALVPVGDIAGLADALARLSADTRYARRLGERAMARVRREFNSSRLAEATQEVYLRALEHRSALPH